MHNGHDLLIHIGALGVELIFGVPRNDGELDIRGEKVIIDGISLAHLVTIDIKIGLLEIYNEKSNHNYEEHHHLPK